MAAPTVDPGIATLAHEFPCMIRHWLGQSGNSALFVNYDFFAWNNQNIDTPVGTPTKWTSDADVKTVGV